MKQVKKYRKQQQRYRENSSYGIAMLELNQRLNSFSYAGDLRNAAEKRGII
jgi:hypothetical protein